MQEVFEDGLISVVKQDLISVKKKKRTYTVSADQTVKMLKSHSWNNAFCHFGEIQNENY